MDNSNEVKSKRMEMENRASREKMIGRSDQLFVGWNDITRTNGTVAEDGCDGLSGEKAGWKDNFF